MWIFPAVAGDAEERAILERVRTVLADHHRRASRMVEGLRERAGPHLDVDLARSLADGVSWAGVTAGFAGMRAEDLVHPAVQAVLLTAAEAVDRSVTLMADLLESAALHELVGILLVRRPDEPVGHATRPYFAVHRSVADGLAVALNVPPSGVLTGEGIRLYLRVNG